MPEEHTREGASVALSGGELSAEVKRGVYEAIFGRRDVRSFRPDPVPEDVLAWLLVAAHHAPSVGFMQPWDFLLVKDLEARRRVKYLFDEVRRAEACLFDEPRRTKHLSMKLKGILDAPLNLCVTCDPPRGGSQVLGHGSILETDVYSTCLAVQNHWLAARAEGIGVGWVSIVTNDGLREIFGIPSHVVPVAYICVGYPEGASSTSRCFRRRDGATVSPSIPWSATRHGAGPRPPSRARCGSRRHSNGAI